MQKKSGASCQPGLPRDQSKPDQTKENDETPATAASNEATGQTPGDGNPWWQGHRVTHKQSKQPGASITHRSNANPALATSSEKTKYPTARRVICPSRTR